MLTVGPSVPFIGGPRLSSPTSESEGNLNTLSAYLHNIAGYPDVEIDAVIKDHCYARPWNWKPENIYVKPTKKIFFPAPEEQTWESDEIDVENEDTIPEVALPYDSIKLRQSMEESQKLANLARPEEVSDDWEENVQKTLWSPIQRRIFTRVINVLSAERLTRLAKVHCIIEPIFRRTSIDAAAKRFREILASTGWDWQYVQWLHVLLIDNCPKEYLAIYLDILQTLRAKIPQLVDRIISVQPNTIAKGGTISGESLAALLKRPWDPISSCMSTNRPKKLPANPILIIAPSGINTNISSRQQKWITQLGTLGTVVTVPPHLGLSASRMTMITCIDQLVQATRSKVQDVRGDCPGRPLILVGFNTGAALACQVAQMEHVTAVVCVGFPISTVEGKRGSSDDMLMDIRCPIMFVIGQNASLVRTDDLEDIREKLLVESSLVVVGTADDHLRISTTKKITEGITQGMVDRCILDEIGDFLGSILMQPHPLPLRSPATFSFDKTMKKDHVPLRDNRKRKNSTSSSVDSESNILNMSKKSRPTTPIDASALVNLQTNSTPIQSVLPKITSVGSSSVHTQQPALITVSGSNTTTVQKRKPRVTSIQKLSPGEQLPIKPHTKHSNGGITVNIGSLASLAPIGPIRLTPGMQNHAATVPAKSTAIPKSSITFNKLPKMSSSVSTNPQVILQTRMQNPSVSSVNWNEGSARNVAQPANQSPYKYTKIILSKKNIGLNTKTGEQIILTKNTRKFVPAEGLARTSNQHRYGQFPVIIASRPHEPNHDGLAKTQYVNSMDRSDTSYTDITEIDLPPDQIDLQPYSTVKRS